MKHTLSRIEHGYLVVTLKNILHILRVRKEILGRTEWKSMEWPILDLSSVQSSRNRVQVLVGMWYEYRPLNTCSVVRSPSVLHKQAAHFHDLFSFLD